MSHHVCTRESMDSFSHDQKIALLAVPMLLFGVLGLAQTARGSAVFPLTEDTTDIAVLERRDTTSRNERSERLHRAILDENYDLFYDALSHTPYAPYRNREVFGALIESYKYHTQGKLGEHDAQMQRRLYLE